MTEPRKVYFDALPKQKEFMACPAREVLYSGAFGAGKSITLCFKLLERACKPGAREGLTRKDAVALKATTLKTLLEGDGKTPAVLPRECYTHLKAEKTIRINGGGEIVYFGLDDPDKVGSYNLTGCAVDQAEELREADWTVLIGRIRVALPGLRNQLYAACNPSVPSHFLAKRFGLVHGLEPARECVAIRTRTTDNTYLPADYVESLDRLTGVARKRFFEGMWVGSDGLIYDNWDAEIHVRKRKEDWKQVLIGVDDGYTNPFVALRIGIDGDGAAHVEREVYKPGLLTPNKVRAVKELGGAGAVCVVDPSAADLIAELRNAGLQVSEADNTVFDGIMRVQTRLGHETGEPRLTVDPSCSNTIREFETYEWKSARGGSTKDEPIKQNDHAMDAIRYCVTRLDGQGRAGAAWITPLVVIGSGDSDKDWGWN